MLLARDTLDVRVGLGGAADSKTTGALDTARAVVSSNSADTSAAIAAVRWERTQLFRGADVTLLEFMIFARFSCVFDCVLGGFHEVLLVLATVTVI